tara:strand:+ start:129 stop:485 length:357 start_codon:yes stop_codon:yes gene_type:complete
MGSRIQKAAKNARQRRKTKERVLQLQEEEANRVVLEGERAAAAKKRRLLRDLERMQQGQIKKKGGLWKLREKLNLNAQDDLIDRDDPVYRSNGRNAPSRKETDDLIVKTTALRKISDR